MNWNEKILEKLQWNGEISNLEQKQKMAKKIANIVKNEDVIGFGSGSTSYLTVQEIAKKVKQEKLNIMAIPTSYEINMACAYLDIPTTSLMQKKPDWCFDGADEVNKNGWIIKGRGGQMFKEKLNMASAKQTYILVDDSKFVTNLCDKFPIPVECNPNAINYVKKALLELGAKSIELRPAKGKDGPIITESGNFILDTVFRNIEETLEKNIKNITGVIESGLFIGYNVIIEK